MEKQLFTDVALNKRAEMLEANAEKVEEMTYPKPLTSEEMEAERMNFSQMAIEISAKQDKMKEITDQHKAELKPMVEAYKETLTMIKTKQRMVKEQVYHLADHADGLMCTYNGRGELIISRRLTPEENQLSIHSSRTLKVAKNG
jgi:hypothetical protein